MNIKLLSAASAAAIIVALGSASASTLTGEFGLHIYNFHAGDAGAASATLDNVNAQFSAGSTVYNGSYIGDLSFSLDTRGGPQGGAPTIGEFLDSGGGVTGVGLGLHDWMDRTLSTGNGSGDTAFGTTTIFDFTGFSAGPLNFTINHDDGITFLDGNGLALTTPGSANPTSEIQTSFYFGGGDFRLIYAAANGDPSILHVDVAAVPLPASFLLLLGALGGFGVVSRRRRNA